MKPRFQPMLGFFCSMMLAPLALTMSVGAAGAQAPRVVMTSSVGPLAAKVPAPAQARLFLLLKASGGREAIRAAQDRALARLAGTSARLLHRYEKVPAMVVGAGLDALPALMGMGDLIEEIREEPGSVPAAEEKKEKKAAAVKISLR